MKPIRLSTVVSMLALSALALPAGARTAADTTGVVRGTVNTAAGKPVADAVVRLLHREKGERKLEEVDSDTTDREGEFRFGKVPDGTYVVVASKGDERDRTEITIHDGKDPAALSFNIRPGKEDREVAAVRSEKKQHVNLVGQVVADGKPVKGATVKLLTGDSDAKTDKMVTVDTDESVDKGRFEFFKVPFGHYIVDVTKGKMHERKEVTLKDTDGTQSIQVDLK